MQDKKNWIIVALGVVIIILWYFGHKFETNAKEQAALYLAANDSLKTSRNEQGQQEAKIALLLGTHEADLLKLETQDETIKKLQVVVEDYKGKLASATVASTSTSENGTTVTVVEHDTLYMDGKEYVYPVYKSEWNEDWSSGRIIASKDSISRFILVHNEFEITQGWKREKWYKEKKAVVNIKNLNPNTETEELRSFVVEEKKKRIAIGVGGAYGVNLFTFSPALVAGVTVQYTLIRF